MTMRNLTIIVLFCGVVPACGTSPMAPTPLDTAPTPAQLVLPEVFQLPPGAPSNAAAPPNTARVTITTIEIAVADKPGGLPGQTLVEYTLGMWMFVPRGLEGLFDIDMRSDDSGPGQGAIGVMVGAGYTRRDFHMSFSTAGSVPLNFVIARNFVTLATTRIVLAVN